MLHSLAKKKLRFKILLVEEFMVKSYYKDTFIFLNILIFLKENLNFEKGCHIISIDTIGKDRTLSVFLTTIYQGEDDKKKSSSLPRRSGSSLPKPNFNTSTPPTLTKSPKKDPKQKSPSSSTPLSNLAAADGTPNTLVKSPPSKKQSPRMKTPPPGCSGLNKTLPTANMIDKTKDPNLLGGNNTLMMTPGGTRIFNDAMQELIRQQRQWSDNVNKDGLNNNADTESELSSDSDDSDTDTENDCLSSEYEIEKVDLNEKIQEKRQKMKESEKEERIRRQNELKVTKKTYAEASKSGLVVDIRAESLDPEKQYRLDQTDYNQINIEVIKLMMAELSKGKDWHCGDTGRKPDEGTVWIEAMNADTYIALMQNVPKMKVPNGCELLYKFATGTHVKEYRIVRCWVHKTFWATRNILETIIRASNRGIRNYIVTEKDGTQRAPRFRIINGGEDLDKEIVKQKDGTPTDNFVLVLEMEECLMDPIVWQAEAGREGYINIGALLKVQLQGGGIEKLINDKKLEEAKKTGKIRKKKTFTPEEMEEKKKRRKARKLNKKLQKKAGLMLPSEVEKAKERSERKKKKKEAEKASKSSSKNDGKGKKRKPSGDQLDGGKPKK